MRIIFVDFDGVLIPLPPDGEYDPIPSEEAVKNLNILAQLTDARVVVSSAWRIDKSVGELDLLLKSWGYRGIVLDKTLDSPDDHRGEEILQWLHNCAKVVDSFVVIDDEPTDLEALAKNRVMPKPEVGLQFHDVQEAAKILTVEKL